MQGCSLISLFISTLKQKWVYKQGSYERGKVLGVPKQPTISSLYLPEPKKEMNLKFDCTQFKFSLPEKTASSLQEYKIKQIRKNVILSTEKCETKSSAWVWSLEPVLAQNA